MPGYMDTSERANSGQSAGQIDQGNVPGPCGHDEPIEDTRPGLPSPMDKPEGQYITSDSSPSMDRFTPITPTESEGDYSKKFA